MKHAPYPKPITDDCPYCGSENVENDHSTCDFTASGGSITCVCADCGKNHRLNYNVESITLEDDANPPNLVDFNVGRQLEDQVSDDGTKVTT